MKLLLLTLGLTALGAALTDDEGNAVRKPVAMQETAMPMPAPTQPDENHEWLQRLVGEWDTTSQCSMGPGTDPMQMECRQTVRSLGSGLWVVAEGEVDMGNDSMSTRLTLGYDPRKDAFVGTWVDSMFAHMWVYTGSLDAKRERLTLETEGPSMLDPSVDAKYRETLEFMGPDRYVFTTSIQGPDGEWTVLVRSESRRRE